MGELKNNERLLMIRDIFKEASDENHKLCLKDIYEMLTAKAGPDFDVDMKSIRSDIDTLCRSGFNIDFEVGRQNAKYYYYEDREFELYELRMLIDAVGSARFISASETESLIEKLKNQTSRYYGQELQNQIYIDKKLKCENKAARFFIHNIHCAIEKKSKIKFRYGCYDVDKTFNLRKDGKEYILSPYALIWNSDYYYVIGIYEGREDFSHYRIDRMRDVSVLDESFERKEFHTISYLRKTFNMYTGTLDTLKLRFKNTLISKVMDRFGKDVEITVKGTDYFEVKVDAALSEGLQRWILSFGSGVKVLSPSSLKESIMQEIKSMGAEYGLEQCDLNNNF
jgi:predicted DNA-binding transcriptional regulator YafY